MDLNTRFVDALADIEQHLLATYPGDAHRRPDFREAASAAHRAGGPVRPRLVCWLGPRLTTDGAVFDTPVADVMHQGGPRPPVRPTRPAPA